MAASSCVISKQQKWFSWGANSYGQLGQGHQHDLSLPRCIMEIPNDVTYVCGGGGHTLFQTAEGKCYACGWNNKGQLGLGSDGKEDTILKPLYQQYINEDILKLAAGWDHSMMITKNGSLHTFGSNAFGQLGNRKKAAFSSTPELVNNPEEPKQDLACGMRHNIILAGNNVYTCGSGKKGQLGQFSPDGAPVNKIDHFEKVILPKGCGKVIQVAAGANHSAAVTDTGQLIVWGDNKHGQLAMNPGVTPVQHTPVIVPPSLFENQRIVEIHSGWTHMLALTDTGFVYVWGRSDYGQLGVGEPRREAASFCQWRPHLLAITNPKKIVCGAEHNLLISGTDELFTWGWNEHGMCGTGDNLDILEPQKVHFFDNQKVTAIGCGSGHSFAQIENL